jgi:hypothetical protein
MPLLPKSALTDCCARPQGFLRQGCVHLLLEVAEASGKQELGAEEQRQLWRALLEAMGPEVTRGRWAAGAHGFKKQKKLLPLVKPAAG